MITEDYVSFDVAQLLKEKGFNEPCEGFYVNSDVLSHTLSNAKNSKWDGDKSTMGYISAPTLQMVMKWLREVYNIAISVYVFNRDLPIKENEIHYTCDVATTKISSKEGHLRLTGTYEEACEAAIKYCLENLI